MPIIVRVWIDLDVDDGSELMTEIQADFGPSAEFIAADDSAIARAQAIELASAFALRLHAAALAAGTSRDRERDREPIAAAPPSVN